MKYLFLIGFILLSYFSFAQKDSLGDYNVRVIESFLHFTIKNTREGKIEYTYKVEIKDEYVPGYDYIKLYYDKFHKISSFKALLSDTAGHVFRKYTLKDCQDLKAGIDEVSSDSRVKLLKLSNNRYPYVLEVSYRVDFKGSMFYPTWYPITAYRQFVEKSTFVVSDLQNVGFRYHAVCVGEPRKEPEGKGFSYTWDVSGCQSVPEEIFARGENENIPVVYTAPVNFEMDGYKGNMESWKNYGKWIDVLSTGKNDLKPDEIKAIKKECEGLASTREKAKAVYRYVQRNTRYASIQLGIGGWQPFSAGFVHRKKYGDCKALSFYTKSLLEAVGVPAYYTLVRAGKRVDNIPVGFPSANFNHVIVTVPLEKDTVWLECTSQTLPFGYMGTFTSDRSALMVDSEGGKLIRTRQYTEDENVQRVQVEMEIAPDGKVELDMKKSFSGLEVERDNLLYLMKESENNKRKWIIDHVTYGRLELRDFRFYGPVGDEVPEAGYEIKGNLDGFCGKSGDRLFFSPFAFLGIQDIQVSAEERILPIEIRYPFTQEDTICVRIPEGYVVETGISPSYLYSPYGAYETQVNRSNDRLYLKRRFVLHGGKYPKEAYEGFKLFIQQVQLQDRLQFVLKPKNKW